MTALRQRMIEDMQLRGLSTSTQGNYVRAVRQLAEHWGKSPDQITEREIREYFLYLKTVKNASPSTYSVVLCGIKFFYQYTLQRNWSILDLIRPVRERKLPVVLSVSEVRQLLGCLRSLRYRTCLTTIYACGLRLREGVGLQVTDVDSVRMVVQVRFGKGIKDRYVPLPDRVLEMLRQYWATHRHPVWLFSSGPTGEGDPVKLLEGWRIPGAVEPIVDRIQPKDIVVFHGDVNVEKLNFIEKSMVKNVKVPVGDFRDWDAITSWAVAIADALKK